ncbi:glycosyltransferase family 4 protein [Lolliginicoccus suaedae]|uniref:glycosyltransferase family 4 protein n=1 Tax=Lolliginicoccus suaedae TaxID=2605429 RepID=UPI0011EF9DC2|nr:glycosyltransferase [Lolliginicoccus suaedae]
MARPARVKHGIYLPVVPRYRQACVDVIDEQLGDTVTHWAGDAHITETVRTGTASPNLVTVRNHFLLGRKVLWQWGHFSEAISAEVLVVDLNPRDLSAWFFLAARRLLRRRTVAWGHLFPRAGRSSPTARVRKVMRRLAHGTIIYDYASVDFAKSELPGQPVWVAPNALYRQADLAPIDTTARRHRILYVGRLVAEKSIDRLLTGFARSGLADRGATLTIVGDGPEKPALAKLAADLGITAATEFLPGVYDAAALRALYAETICSVSPGYAGLSITQSLGFGVPIVVSENELHAPEIELDRTGGVLYYDATTDDGLATALVRAHDNPDQINGEDLRAYVHDNYSAEAMATGVIAALRGADPR